MCPGFPGKMMAYQQSVALVKTRVTNSPQFTQNVPSLSSNIPTSWGAS